jgi:hypothetical protein
LSRSGVRDAAVPWGARQVRGYFPTIPEGGAGRRAIQRWRRFRLSGSAHIAPDKEGKAIPNYATIAFIGGITASAKVKETPEQIANVKQLRGKEQK